MMAYRHQVCETWSILVNKLSLCLQEINVFSFSNLFKLGIYVDRSMSVHDKHAATETKISGGVTLVIQAFLFLIIDKNSCKNHKKLIKIKNFIFQPSKMSEVRSGRPERENVPT